MKKTYITPALKVIKLGTEKIIADSRMHSSYGMGYGGVDTSGNGNANVKGYRGW